MTMKCSPIAIIGLAGTFPGAQNLSQFWQNIIQAKSAIETVPPHRWPSRYFDPDSKDPGKFYTQKGGFIDRFAQFEALRFGVMPHAVHGAEPDQLMSLQVAAEALEDAGYAPRSQEEGSRGRAFDRQYTEVIIGRGGYIGPAMNSLNQRVRTTEQVLSLVQQKGWLDSEQLQQLKNDFLSQVRPFGPDTAIGLVPNLCASRVADRLGLGGAAYTIDAACASALVAVTRACESLDCGRAHLAIAGGIHMVHDLTFWSVFSQLGALSRQQTIRPFHAQADGLLIGEGVGLVVLKRLTDALNDGDRVYAVIQGFGSSSDGGKASLMSPDVQGQIRAMSQAWTHLDLERVGLIEAHGTGTPAGDQAELTSTRAVFGDLGCPLAIGSVKSNIGHTMPAAGAAGLIKAALSIYHGVKPPSLNIDEPHPLFGGRLYPSRQLEAWNEERWAGVSAFGFGGINAHLALSQAPSYSPLRPKISRFSEPISILGIAAHNDEELAESLEHLAHQSKLNLKYSQSRGEGSVRVALIDPNRQSLLNAAQAVRSGQKRQGRKGLWLNRKGLLLNAEQEDSERISKGKIAYLFPGIEASFAPRIDDLCVRLGIPTPKLFPPNDLGERGVSVIRLGITLARCMRTLGVEPDHICGHSIGEWTGLIAAGFFSESAIELFIQGLDPQGLSIPEVAFVAAGAGHEKVTEVLTRYFEQDLSLLGIYCSHDNCPHQSIYCVPLDQTQHVLNILEKAQIIAQELPFRSGFHAPHFKPYATEIAKHMRSLSIQNPQYTLWSATTGEVYPSYQEPEALYVLSGQHLIEPVRFRGLIDRLYAEGVRVFIQMGVGSLSSFVSDTLRGRPHRVIDAHSERRSGWAQWLQLVGTLYSEGLDLDLNKLPNTGQRSSQAFDLDLSAGLIELTSSTRSTGHSNTSTSIAEISSQMMGSDQGKPSFVGAQVGIATYPSPLRLERQDLQSVESQSLISKKYIAEWPLSVRQYPHLEDHCFFRQPLGWPILEDRFPVVPMTLSIQWAMEVAQQLADEKGEGQRVVSVHDVRASKWIELDPPQTIKVTAEWLDQDVIRVELLQHLSARVKLAYTPPNIPNIPWQAQKDERLPPVSAEDIYKHRWMFHGPAYQGIHQLIAMSPLGIRGMIRNDGVPGALLDNVGQIFGLWVMLTQQVDRVVMPVRLAELKIFGPPPPLGALLPCEVRITRLERRDVQANMVLWCDGKVWATFAGWSDWRFETSGQLWSLMRYPESTLYAQTLFNQGGITLSLVEGISAVDSSREFLVGRCLNREERVEYRNLSKRRQRDWLAGRIAAKDALRQWAWSNGENTLFPIEIGLRTSESQHAPSFDYTALPQSLNSTYPLSISHSDGNAVAVIIHPHSPYSKVGIDLERVNSHSTAWQDSTFSATELNHLSSVPDVDKDDALTILWTIKEASAKCMNSSENLSGLGAPRKWVIESVKDQGVPQLANGVEVTVSGSAQVCLTTTKQRFKVAWWFINSDQKKWALALCIEH